MMVAVIFTEALEPAGSLMFGPLLMLDMEVVKTMGQAVLLHVGRAELASRQPLKTLSSKARLTVPKSILKRSWRPPPPPPALLIRRWMPPNYLNVLSTSFTRSSSFRTWHSTAIAFTSMVSISLAACCAFSKLKSPVLDTAVLLYPTPPTSSACR